MKIQTILKLATIILLVTWLIASPRSTEDPNRPDIRPLEDRHIVRIVRTYGNGHHGIDFAAFVDTPVMATGAGKVVHSRWSDTYGNHIIIRHNFFHKGKITTVYTLYAHLNEFKVLQGSYVEKRQIIALTGNTGRSNGPHLHYEMRCVNNRHMWQGTYQRWRGLEEGRLQPRNQRERDYLEWFFSQPEPTTRRR